MIDILHFLGEDVSNIEVAWDVLDGKEIIGYIFPNEVLPHLDMSCVFSSGPLAPVHTGPIVIVNDRRFPCGEENVAVIHVLKSIGEA